MPRPMSVNVHGTRYEEREGNLVRVVDRTGCVHAELTWDGDSLVRLAVAGAVIEGTVVADALLDRAHAILPTGPAATTPVTTMSAIEWTRPREIPVITAPTKLPPGSAAPIMNVLALLAQRAGVPALRYAGPYPTNALWRTLLRSFRTASTEEEFTADAAGRAARIARDPIAIDFVPAPHERVAIDNGHIELRDGVERAVIHGVSYDQSGSPARLIDSFHADTANGEIHAEVWFGDEVYARIATFASDGTLIDGPRPMRPCTSDVIGREFPLALRGAIAQLVADAVPAPLAASARAILAAQCVRWADLGARAAHHDATGFRVHAALWDRIAPLGLGRLALALAEALAPVVATAVIASATPTL